MKTKFEYGALYDIHPTWGIDIEKGKYQIFGIMHCTSLPDWVNVEAWETGDAEFDFLLISEPWYALQNCECEDDDQINFLPEFAMREVTHKANIEKVKAWTKESQRKNQIINSIILG